MQKSKPKGTPGRRQQNLMFMVGGLLAGIVGTVLVVVFLMQQSSAAQPVPTPVLPTVTSTPTNIPPMMPTFTPLPYEPNATPTPLPAMTFAPVQGVERHPITAMTVAPNGALLALSYQYAGHGMLNVRRLDMASGSLNGQEFQLAQISADKLLFSPTGDKLAAVQTGGDVFVYNVASRMEMLHFAGGMAAAFSPDGHWLILGGNNELTVLDATTLMFNRTIPVNGTVETMDIASDNRIAFAFHEPDGTHRVHVIALDEPASQSFDAALDAPVHDLKFRPDGGLLAIAYGDHVMANDLRNGDRFEFDMSIMGTARALAFSPNGFWLAAAGGDFEAGFAAGAYAWKRDVSGTLPVDRFGIESQYLAGHLNDVTAITFLKDGAWLLTASTDGTLRLWDYAVNGAQVAQGEA